jgi:hypothetical protein
MEFVFFCLYSRTQPLQLEVSVVLSCGPSPHFFSLIPTPPPQNEQRQHITRYKSTNTLRMISGQQSVLSARITPAEVGGGTRVNNKTNQSKLFLFEYPRRHIYDASVLIVHGIARSGKSLPEHDN